MLNRLWVRITLAFIVVILLGAAMLAVTASRINNENQRERIAEHLVNRRGGLADGLTQYHRKNPDWQGIDLFMSGVDAAAFSGRARAYFRLSDINDNVLHDSRPDGFKQDHADKGSPRSIAIIDRRTDQKIANLQIFASGPWRPPGEPPPSDDDPLGNLSRTLQFVLLVSVPLGILGSIWISRSLTSPLNQLANAARDVGSGNLDRRLELSGTVEMREVAHAFNEMTSDLQESEQLRRNLVADIAHELRTPLTVVQGNLRAILDDIYPLDKEEITRLYDQTRILAQLVQDLRDVAQAEAGQLVLNLVNTDVGKLVQETAATFSSLAEEEKVALQIDTSPDLPTLPVDPTRIAQVLHNLLSNAVRHTPADGTISVTATPTDGGIKISVSDTGAGIATEHLPRVFERFYRTDRARDRDSGGTGLGLSIARALVEAHGGTIRAASAGIGQGTTFTISLKESIM